MAVSVVSVRRVVCIVGLVLLVVVVRPTSAAKVACYRCQVTDPAPDDKCLQFAETSSLTTVAVPGGSNNADSDQSNKPNVPANKPIVPGDQSSNNEQTTTAAPKRLRRSADDILVSDASCEYCFQFSVTVAGKSFYTRDCDNNGTMCAAVGATGTWTSFNGTVGDYLGSGASNIIGMAGAKAEINCCADAKCNSKNFNTNGTHNGGPPAAVQPLNLITVYAIGLLSFYVGGLAF